MSSPDEPPKSEAWSWSSLNGARVFYSGAAVLMLALSFAGFHHFYLHGQASSGEDIMPSIRPLLIVHGIGMSLWMLLFVVQTLLIAARHRRVHMMLGPLGGAVSLWMIVLGLQVAIEVTKASPPGRMIDGLYPKPFMIVPIMIICAFAFFVIAGLWNRRRPEIHRPMMLLAGLAAMPAPITRIDFMNNLYIGTVWDRRFGEYFGTLLLGLLLFFAKWLLTRSFDRWFAAGFAGLVVAAALMMRIATSGVWDRVATFLVR